MITKQSVILLVSWLLQGLRVVIFAQYGLFSMRFISRKVFGTVNSEYKMTTNRRLFSIGILSTRSRPVFVSLAISILEFHKILLK